MSFEQNIQLFATNYLLYCKHLHLNVAAHCRHLQETKNIKLSDGKYLWKWKTGETTLMSAMTLFILAESVNKPLTYFLDENFKLPDQV